MILNKTVYKQMILDETVWKQIIIDLAVYKQKSQDQRNALTND